MISERDVATIAELAVRYDVGRILLFGSAADPNREARDIDLAVEGIAPEAFFKFYGELMLRLSKPVDLIDLSDDCKFTRIVRQEGVPIVGNAARSD